MKPSENPNWVDVAFDTDTVAAMETLPAWVDTTAGYAIYTNGNTELAVGLIDGSVHWRIDLNLHRDHDLPAQVRSDGSRAWLQRGHFHRDGDRPARISADGAATWFNHGAQHRDNGQPSHVHLAAGRLDWHRHGILHRDGGPAYVHGDLGALWWAQQGRVARFDGPARVDANYHAKSSVRWVPGTHAPLVALCIVPPTMQ